MLILVSCNIYHSLKFYWKSIKTLYIRFNYTIERTLKALYLISIYSLNLFVLLACSERQECNYYVALARWGSLSLLRARVRVITFIDTSFFKRHFFSGFNYCSPPWLYCIHFLPINQLVRKTKLSNQIHKSSNPHNWTVLRPICKLTLIYDL